MTARDVDARYQWAARAWLSAAAASFLLPVAARRGLWLPLHLALAGAIATAIAGAMQHFAGALTATPGPSTRVVATQFGLLAVGVAAIAVGVPAGLPALAAAGGASFVAAMGILGAIVLRARRRSLHRRHAAPIAAYLFAVAAVLLGATLGALLGAGLLPASAYVAARGVHLTLNVLGFASLTIAGTLITFLPTVLRVKMPAWPAGAVIGLLACGVVAIVAGWAAGWAWLAVAGGVAQAAGALGVVGGAAAALRTRRRFRPPTAALHLVAGIGWFVAGSIGVAVVAGDGPLALVRYRTGFLLVFVGGWLIQVLLGAWSFLLPMRRPGHPDERRRELAAFELGGRTQVVLWNAGIVLAVLASFDSVASEAGVAGLVVAGVGFALALAKAWLFPLLARGPVETARARAIWGEPRDR